MVVPFITDHYGFKIFDLRHVDKIVYNGFYIVNPHDDRFLVFMKQNTGNYAEWLAKQPVSDFNFSCHALRERQKRVFYSIEELYAVYNQAWKKHPNSFSFHGKIMEWNGKQVIRFQEKGRNPQDGRLIYIDGFALPDPEERDHIIEVKYIRCAYQKDIEKYGMRELGELFLKSVFIGDGD